MSESIELRVNGVAYPVAIDTASTLSRVLRDDLGLTGTKEGCDDCECGACIVLLDGQPVNSCSYLAAQAQGRDITTVEGLSGGDTLHPLHGDPGDRWGAVWVLYPRDVVVGARAVGRERISDR